MPSLIVNADDFGITEGTNRAIVDAHRTGIVTSTSLLANGYAFDHAVELARQHPSLKIGVHLTLTEGPPVSANSSALFGSQGELPLSNQPFFRALITGRLPEKVIRSEFEAQVMKILHAGITPTHIDGHKYIHLLPGITPIAAQVACQFGIPVMRIPHGSGDRLSRFGRVPGLMILLFMGKLARHVAIRAGLKTPDRTVGFVDTGHLDLAAIKRLVGKPVLGITELLCHPAYRSAQLDALLTRGYRWIQGYDFDAETAAVSSPVARGELEAAGWRLCGFDSL